MKFYSDMTKKLYESEEELKTAEKEVADAYEKGYNPVGKKMHKK